MGKKIHEIKECVKPLEEACKTLEKHFCSEVECNMHGLNVSEAMAAADMIKDLCEAKEKCYKAAYYEAVVEAMEDGEDNWEESDRPGYNHNHYKSSGRFAPSGMGSRTGFTHPISETGDPHHMNMTNQDMENIADDVMQNNREFGRGIHYRNYVMSRRGYTESRDNQSKMKYKTDMDEHAQKHILETAETIKEMYMNADPSLKVKIKESISKLLSDMN